MSRRRIDNNQRAARAKHTFVHRYGYGLHMWSALMWCAERHAEQQS